MYRTPPDPGFVGGYNWPGVIAGLVLLLVVNAAATQFIAHRFAYQAALGIPVYSFGDASVYQPFAWAPWLLKHGSTANPKVRLPLLSR
jgi:type IV secretion system protein VirD4